MHQIQPPDPLPPLRQLCHSTENNHKIEHNPFCASLVSAAAPGTFHHFPLLPVELQLKVFQYAFYDAIRTNCSIYQVQHINHADDSTLLNSYAARRLVISCGNRWPPKEHPLGLRKVNFLSRQISLEETQKVFDLLDIDLLDEYIELCDPRNERALQMGWALPFLEVATTERIEPVSEKTQKQLLAGRPEVQWLNDDWICRLSRKNVVRCRQVVWSQAWDEKELERRYVLTLERWQTEAEEGLQSLEGPIARNKSARSIIDVFMLEWQRRTSRGDVERSRSSFKM